ncbi:MAG: serine hydrolase domain-containing protein [Pseudomonadota bacterium]
MTVRSSLAAIVIVTSLLVLAVSAAIAAPDVARDRRCVESDVEKRIDVGLSGLIDVMNISGVSVGIVCKGELAYANGFGFADRSQSIMATSTTEYAIASVSKTFAATLAVILEEEGVIELDDPVVTYLPSEAVFTDGAPRLSEITVRHLLTHTSGLVGDPPNRRNLSIESPYNPGVWDKYSITDLYNALNSTKLEHPPGSVWSYSNFGYALLGHVLERASGLPYDRLLRDKLLDPLEMDDTQVALGRRETARLAAFYWSGDTDRQERPYANFGEVTAFGGMTSSVNDLAKYVRFYLANEDNIQFPLSRDAIRRMWEPEIAFTDASYPQAVFQHQTPSSIMGLGWWIWQEDGKADIYEHPGELDGHVAAVWLSPDHDIGVIVLLNMGGPVGTNALRYIEGWLIDILLDSKAAGETTD